MTAPTTAPAEQQHGVVDRRPAAAATLTALRRIRWAVRATLVLGVAASVAANILHADPNSVSQAIAAWPPLALLLTVELISRVPVYHRALAVVRLAATAIISGIAAYVSYWHMTGVAARYGETGASPYLLPLSVDGLVVVASISLVELAGRIRAAEQSAPADGGLPASAPASKRPAPPPADPDADPSHRQVPPDDTQRAVASPSIAGTTGDTDVDQGRHPLPVDPDSGPNAVHPTEQNGPDIGDGATNSGDDTEIVGSRDSGYDKRGLRADERDDEPPATTAAAVAYWLDKEPTLQPADVAAKIGKSYRTVRRHWPGALTAATATSDKGARDTALTRTGAARQP